LDTDGQELQTLNCGPRIRVEVFQLNQQMQMREVDQCVFALLIGYFLEQLEEFWLFLSRKMVPEETNLGQQFHRVD
jgi:hypothetical protein